MADLLPMALHPREILLGRAGIDRVGEEATSDKVWQASFIFARGREDTETIPVEKESISCAKVEERGRKVSRRNKRKQDYTSGRDAGQVKGGDRASGRSSKELGIVFPGSHCVVSPTNAHHYVELVREIFRCRHCWVVLWQPRWFPAAVNFSTEIDRLGLQEAYQRRVSRMPTVRDAILTLNGLGLIRDMLSKEDIAEIISTVKDSLVPEESTEGFSHKAMKKALMRPELWGG